MNHYHLHHFHFCCYVLFGFQLQSINYQQRRKWLFRDKLDHIWKIRVQLLCNFQFGGKQGHLERKTSWGHDRSEWRKSDREKLGMSGKSSGIVKNLGHHLPTKTKAKHSWRYMKIFLIFSPSIPGYLGHSDLRTHWSIHSKSQDRNFAIFFAPHMIYLVCIHIVSLWAA